MIEKNRTFQAFDPHREMHIYRRHLPHWRQNGATYFVTTRLADSIPQRILDQWREEDRIWLNANGVRGPISDPQWREVYNRISERQRIAFERRAARRLHLALDRCEGSCIFRQRASSEILLHAMQFFHDKRWRLGDLVIMPNHLHALVQPIEGFELEDVLQSVKRFVSTELGKQAMKPSKGSLWQKENYDRIVRDREELQIFRRYIEQNPLKAKLRDNEYRLHKADWL